MTQRRGLVLLIGYCLVMLTTGSVTRSPNRLLPRTVRPERWQMLNTDTTRTRAGFNLYLLGDFHWPTLLGSKETGRKNILDAVRYIRNDPKAIGFIVNGDCAYTMSDGLEDGHPFVGIAGAGLPAGCCPTTADSINFTDSLFTDILGDSLRGVPVFPVPGNWDYTKIAGKGDYSGVIPGVTASGLPYNLSGGLNDGRWLNQFASKFAGRYALYRSSSDRGRRWFAIRPIFNGIESNLLIFSADSNHDADSTVSNYPQLGRHGFEPNRFGPRDFDGYCDTTSTQRKDFASFVQKTYRTGDWILLAGTRPFKSFVKTDRFEDPLAFDSQGIGTFLENWCTTHDIKRYIMNGGDTHENLWFKHPRRHYFQIHSTVALRTMSGKAAFTDSSFASGLAFFAYNDSVKSSTGTAESVLGLKGQTNSRPDGSLSVARFIMLTRIAFLSQDHARLQAIMLYRDATGASYALVDSPIVSTYNLSRTQ